MDELRPYEVREHYLAFIAKAHPGGSASTQRAKVMRGFSDRRDFEDCVFEALSAEGKTCQIFWWLDHDCEPPMPMITVEIGA